MLGEVNLKVYLRGVTAAFLALFLGFASLVPLAARSFTSSSHCCRTRFKCCCHKDEAGHPAGPTLAGPNSACGTQCGGAAIGTTAAVPLVESAVRIGGLSTARSLAPAIAEGPAHIRLIEHALEQRPPPSAVLA